MMKPLSPIILGVFCLFLAACGGARLTPTVPTAAIAARAGVTTAVRPSSRAAAAKLISAWGTLVDYSSGAPIAGQPVKLMPWHLCPYSPEHYSAADPMQYHCPKPVAQTVTGKRGYFTFKAPPGLYLLVIGPDTPAWPTPPEYATVHDKLWIYPSPKRQRMFAPNICTYTGEPRCLPPVIPSITPGYKINPVQESGKYRLIHLDDAWTKAVEWPCIQTFNTERVARGLIPDIVDEWSEENNRMFLYYGHLARRYGAPSVDSYGALAAIRAWVFGGSNCTGLMQRFFDPTAYMPGYSPYSAPTNPQAAWMAAGYIPYGYDGNDKVNAFGAAQFPRDPRGGYRNPVLPAYWP